MGLNLLYMGIYIIYSSDLISIQNKIYMWIVYFISMTISQGGRGHWTVIMLVPKVLKFLIEFKTLGTLLKPWLVGSD